MTWKRSLRAETSAILVIAMLLSHLAGYLIYTTDRRDAIEITEAVDIAERAAGISRLLRDLPPSWRAEVIKLSDSRTFRVWTTAVPIFEANNPTEDEINVRTYLRTQVPRISDHEMYVAFIKKGGRSIKVPDFDLSSRSGSPSSAIDNPEDGPGIAITIRHQDNEWINFLGVISTPKSFLPELVLSNLVSAVFGIVIVAFWLVGRVTNPLKNLAEAAEGLGQDLYRPELDSSGPKEVAVAADAVNRMQRRLVRLIQGRTELLAAISHDLRTPLTQLRLRLELTEPSKHRDKAFEAIDDMDSTIGTFLAFARAEHESENRSLVDLGALVASICDDLADCGAAIECDCESGVLLNCKPQSIKRAILNLIDNALKYGVEARVTVAKKAKIISVTVKDRGPGIPETEMEAMFRPFHRGSNQINLQKGGSGLGLSIALAIIEDHGGDINFKNRAGGGLVVTVKLVSAW
ncbi:ATP-binding protein [Thioclava sp. F36-7]|uniref:sensor histidine kinase n=1 Tax=Thioclava sp. F36-7 TaxID=1915317 RepID=UPI000998B3FB|nr:ATP-binding protein [Thioclava sp. F36-7]OOY07013.1 hypothetical protein BMI89_19745 [Thioclava sp. F36-7]